MVDIQHLYIHVWGYDGQNSDSVILTCLCWWWWSDRGWCGGTVDRGREDTVQVESVDVDLEEMSAPMRENHERKWCNQQYFTCSVSK